MMKFKVRNLTKKLIAPTNLPNSAQDDDSAKRTNIELRFLAWETACPIMTLNTFALISSTMKRKKTKSHRHKPPLRLDPLPTETNVFENLRATRDEPSNEIARLDPHDTDDDPIDRLLANSGFTHPDQESQPTRPSVAKGPTLFGPAVPDQGNSLFLEPRLEIPASTEDHFTSFVEPIGPTAKTHRLEPIIDLPVNENRFNHDLDTHVDNAFTDTPATVIDKHEPSVDFNAETPIAPQSICVYPNQQTQINRWSLIISFLTLITLLAMAYLLQTMNHELIKLNEKIQVINEKRTMTGR